MKRATLILLACFLTGFAGEARADWTDSTGAPILASPTFGDLTGDGVDEILLTTYGIVNPYGEGWLYAWDGAGSLLPNYPIFLTGAPPATPAVGDLDGDGDNEIVQGTWNYLYVFNADGTPFAGWPKSKYITQAAALADLDGDGDLEIIVPSSNSMAVFHHDGTSYAGFPVTGANDLTSPAVGDLDGDGDLEIVAGSFVASGSTTDHVYAWHHDGTGVNGFPTTTDGSVKAAPALADLDGDGTMEVLANCWNKSGTDFFYVWDHAGRDEPGWPLAIPYIRMCSPSVADLDRDGDLEIVVGGWSTNPYTEEVHAYEHDGTPVTGFPVLLNNSPSGNINSTCTTGDIDGDDYPEIVVKAVNNIYALNHDGSLCAGFPVFIDDTSHSGTTSPTPAIGDPDGDGRLEIFAAACFDTVMLMDQDGVFSADLLAWPTYRRDGHNGGTFTPPSLAADVHSLSGAAGGHVTFTIDAGAAHAGRDYIVAGSVSGTHPGTLLPGGLAVIPLNRDFITNFIISHLGSAFFTNFAGKLDASGGGTALFDTMGPVPPAVMGKTMHFAYALRTPWNFASNAVAVVVL